MGIGAGRHGNAQRAGLKNRAGNALAPGRLESAQRLPLVLERIPQQGLRQKSTLVEARLHHLMAEWPQGLALLVVIPVVGIDHDEGMQRFCGADGRTRTGKEIAPRQILSLLRLPFRHIGGVGLKASRW